MHSLLYLIRSLFSVKNGHIKRITDQDIQSSVLEIMSTNVSTTYITCPADPTKTLGIKLPFLVMIIKNLKKYFSFEVQVLDDKGVRRRFRASNYQVQNYTVAQWKYLCGCLLYVWIYAMDRQMKPGIVQSLAMDGGGGAVRSINIWGT